MRFVRGWSHALVGHLRELVQLVRLRHPDADLDEEIRAHIELATEEYLRQGMTPEAAAKAARRDFGGVDQVKERHREGRRGAWMDHLCRDLRIAVRGLRKRPGFTFVAVLTLAIGIGANSAIFAVVRSVLLEPLPYADSEELVAVWLTAPGAPNVDLAAPGEALYFTARDRSRTFEEIGLWSSRQVAVTGEAEPEEVTAVSVTTGVFPVLAAGAARGRLFLDTDGEPEAPATAVLDHAYWQRRFGGDPSVVGSRLRVDGIDRRVVGVLEEGLALPEQEADVYLPHQWSRAGTIFTVSFLYRAVARLAPGATLEQAGAELDRLLPLSVEEFPGGMDRNVIEMVQLGSALMPLKADVVGDIGQVLWLLLGTVGIVLLVACANVANLFLTRAEGRRREVAVRSAIGASRAQVARQLLVEGGVLGLAGGVVALVVALGGVEMLRRLDPEGLPRLAEVAVSPGVVGFTLAVALLSGLALGLLPVLRVGRPDLTSALKEGGRWGTTGRERHRVAGTLVVAQTALALVLLAASGLMVRSLLALRAVESGFQEPAAVMTFRVGIPSSEIEDPAEVALAFEEMWRELSAAPGVSSVGVSSSVPMTEYERSGLIWIEEGPLALDELPPSTRVKFISGGYHETMGIPLVAGRTLTWDDVRQRAPVAVVTESFAVDNFRSAEAALGRRITTGDPARPAWREIVGVARDVRDDGVDRAAPWIVYWPMVMADLAPTGLFLPRTTTFVLRADRRAFETAAFLDRVQEAVWSVNPNLPISQVQSLDSIVARSMARTSFTLVMLGIAAGVALLLGVVGIYGVTSFVVSQRRREIGLRMAFGARAEDVRAMVLKRGMLLTGAGVLLGIVVAAALTRVMTSLLYGVEPTDPATFAGGAVLLVFVSWVATWLPARRASRTSPMVVLRRE